MMTRFAIPVASGLLTAATLLWLMQLLVTPQHDLSVGADTPAAIEFVRLKREEYLQLKERKLPPPPEQVKLPPRPRLDMPAESRPVAPRLDMALNLNLPLDLGKGPYLGPMAASLDRDFMPLSRPAPRYPYQAARRGTEGWVRVSFTVTQTGSVEDAVILDSQPAGVFDQAALQAVYRWRFKPRIVDGRPTAGRAVQVVEFVLDKQR